ncbi:(2Fe-2S) ferredoxin domain-containing protein [Coxiella endosymbiont of Amblyomma americanum]|uniref:(2Fe-2S) ferredoxin domain-containing protein n=1 Tax=Coxiella endosymbiont of Amblyomma americanum TaxID=325775 RepID=UPI00057F0377|nr:ferredoxin [Coxiella endosymbiont of Amblyomma americanum]AJC50630.1 ferredoxin [Coxiella endosymbiont of Amblyomma americanum]AUJ58958.1 ferredoxin [Coxiella-like endosymbiont of Amblyomma americanum]
MIIHKNEKLQCKLNTLKLEKIRHHIFLCCNQTNPRCCSKNTGMASWEYLRTRLNELNLTGVGGIYQTKVDCLRICYQGPIAIVYPRGIWYHSCNLDVIEKIIQNHFIGGKPVEENILFKKNENQYPFEKINKYS